MQVYNNELYHYGVMGMKWGHRKKQESPSISKARDKLYKEKVKLKKAEKIYIKNSKSKKNLDDYNSSLREHRYAKEDLKKTIILDKLNGKEKTNSQLKMEYKYKQRGMSDDEAAVAAYNNIKTKKIIAAIGATTLTAAAAYGGYKMWDKRVDKILKSGTTLQNIASESDEGLKDAFYSSKHSLDKMKYKGLYGSHLAESGEKVVNRQIKVLSDIKQASYKNAHQTLKEVASNDKEFINSFHEYIKDNKGLWSGKTRRTMDIADRSLSKGIVDEKTYEAFNIFLVDHTPRMQKLTDKYFNALSDKGYNAIKDINDSKYSGYDAINPIISFNTKNKVELSKVTQLSKQELSKHKHIQIAHMFGSEMVKQGMITTGSILGANLYDDFVKENKDKKVVSKYREEYPDSKLSNTEIIRMIERN